MPYINQKLPNYPCKCDVWDILQAEKRPIVVYGMGNGADKLISRFSKYGIEIADFFASDGFVRGHFFHGKRVKSFSEIKNEYSDFVIVLSFASNRDEVIKMLLEIDGKYDMYCPDMPIASTTYFDKDFFNENYKKIKLAEGLLSDEMSKDIFRSVISYRLTGKISHILGTYSEKSEKYELINQRKIENMLDLGAYNGDTVREALCYFGQLKRVYAVEPDKRNFKKLVSFANECDKIDIKCINAAAYSMNGEAEFSQSGNRNSTISGTKSYQNKTESVKLIKADSVTDFKIDYIKYDVEGAEREALLGSDEIIRRDRPALSVSVYHKSDDIFALILELSEKYKGYNFYLRRTKCVPAWEIDLIMI
jgi:FkbM family methyltransferase